MLGHGFTAWMNRRLFTPWGKLSSVHITIVILRTLGNLHLSQDKSLLHSEASPPRQIEREQSELLNK